MGDARSHDATGPREPGHATSERTVEVSKSADDILASIFAPVAEATPLEQLEETLRRPKRLVYIAISNRNFYWRMHITKFVLDEGFVPINPFMPCDYYLLH